MSGVATELVDGDCIDVMQDMDPNSVHAIVSDPPYGLAFMGESWDQFDPGEYQAWCQEWAEAALGVLKPGGHMLAFSGSRTFHRLFVGIEDAGFEIRDAVMWLHAQGFPKGQEMGKAIDKKRGKEDEREVIGESARTSPRLSDEHDESQSLGSNWHGETGESGNLLVTGPVTPEAKQWDGWNTQLKPAFEPLVLARKPIAEATIAEQVLATGTGALAIRACRVGDAQTETHVTDMSHHHGNNWGAGGGEKDEATIGYKTNPPGRYPPNVVLDEAAAAQLDEQGPYTKSRSRPPRQASGDDEWATYSRDDNFGDRTGPEYDDEGGPSRFYYTSKATTAERTMDGQVENPHPTVKPIDLTEWLVELVSAEGQTVLDPFAGSGTTLLAAYNLGRNSIGIEQDDEFVEIARERIEANGADPDLVGSAPTHIYDDPLDW